MTDDIFEQRNRQKELADNVEAASQELARAVNFQLVTGPAAHDILGNLKLALSHLREVADHLPQGLSRSLDDGRITVTDRDYVTGEERDPAAQVVAAAEYLRTISIALQTAAEAAELAQGSLNSQGFEAKGL